MRTSIFSLLSVILIASFSLTSCSKSDDTDPNNNNNSSGGVTITVKDSYGVLAAITSISYTTVAGITVPVTTNTAVAVFNASAGSTTYVDAGSVTLNGQALTKNSNNAYVYDNLTSPLSFPPITWNVAGSGSVPAINYTDDKAMPTYSGYESLPSTISKATGFTVTLGSSVTKADSVYVLVTDASAKVVLKRLGGSASEAVFTSSDLSALGNTSVGMIQVVPWNFKVEDFNDKPYYFVNETAYSKIGVTIN